MADTVRKGPNPTNQRYANNSAAPYGLAAGDTDRVVTVLAISPLEDDHTFLRNIFSHSNWKLRGALTWADGSRLLQESLAPVVIAESVLPDAGWKDVLRGLGRMARTPLLIVSSRLADERLWAEVLNLGGYDVLMKPFEPTEVFRVVSLAWLSWKDNCQRMAVGQGHEILAS